MPDRATLLDATPRLSPTVDVTKLNLGPREAFVLSRIDGGTTAAALADLVGATPDEVLGVLERLGTIGAIQWEGGELDQLAADEAELTPQLDPEVQRALAEPGDLTRAERLRILAAQRDLRTRTYWELFGLHGNPTGADIKRAYFDASKQFHPDRFFGKALGSFAGRLDELFRGIKKAYEVLGDEAARAKYSNQHPAPQRSKRSLVEVAGQRTLRKGKTPPPGPSAAEQEEKRRRLEARRAEIVDERKKKQQAPVADSARKAQELFELGQEQMKKKDLAAAASSFKLALAYAPQNQEYQRHWQEANDATLAQRSAQLIEAADVEAATGQYAAAAKNYARAADLLPAQGSYALRAAELFLQSGDNAMALDYAQRAVRALPRKKEARLIACQLLQESGQLEAALAHLEIAASLDRDDAHVKKAVKELAKRLKRS